MMMLSQRPAISPRMRTQSQEVDLQTDEGRRSGAEFYCRRTQEEKEEEVDIEIEEKIEVKEKEQKAI